MIQIIICGYNIFCQVDSIRYQFARPKYPPDVTHLCQYFEEQKTELPDYCKWHDEPFVPKRRSDF